MACGTLTTIIPICDFGMAVLLDRLFSKQGRMGYTLSNEATHHPPAKLRHSGDLLFLPRAPDRMAASSSQSPFTSFEKPAAPPPAAGFFVSGVVISEIGSLRASTQSLTGFNCPAQLIPLPQYFQPISLFSPSGQRFTSHQELKDVDIVRCQEGIA